jgi:hypothetical protein
MMRTITWDKGDGTVAVTTILDSELDPAEHAAELLERGDVPAEYVPIAFNEPLPATGWPLEAFRVDEQKRVTVDVEAAKEYAVRVLTEKHGVRESEAQEMLKSAGTVEELQREMVAAGRIDRARREP